MRKNVLVICLLVGLAGAAFAQRTATLTIKNAGNSGIAYVFDVWARSTGGTAIRVGTSSFFFNYNSAGMDTPTLTNINPNYTGDGVTTDYDAMTVQLVGGKIGVTVTFTAGGGGTGSLLSTASPDGERLCTVRMHITDPAQTAGLSWDALNTGVTNSVPAASVASNTVGSDNSLLPITLSSFVAQLASDRNQVRLEWKTISEINNYGFEVQRSLDGKSFESIPGSFVPGNGTTNVSHTYSYVDANPAGTTGYRLKQIDLDGTTSYSESVQPTTTTDVKEQKPTVFALEQNYPNPFNPTTVVEFALPSSSHVLMELYNLLGQKVQTLVDDVRQAGFYRVRVDGANLSSGVYLYRLSTGDKVFVRKMTLVK